MQMFLEMFVYQQFILASLKLDIYNFGLCAVFSKAKKSRYIIDIKLKTFRFCISIKKHQLHIDTHITVGLKRKNTENVFFAMYNWK